MLHNIKEEKMKKLRSSYRIFLHRTLSSIFWGAIWQLLPSGRDHHTAGRHSSWLKLKTPFLWKLIISSGVFLHYLGVSFRYENKPTLHTCLPTYSALPDNFLNLTLTKFATNCVTDFNGLSDVKYREICLN